MNRRSVYILLRVYIFSLVIFSLIRLGFFIYQKDYIFQSNGVNGYQILHAFLFGIRYDAVITGYALIIPAILLIINDFKKSEILDKIAFIFIFVVISIMVFLGGADIVYFNKFYQHIDLSAFHWLDKPDMVAGMVFSELRYWILFIPYFIFLFIFYKFLKRLFQKSVSYHTQFIAKRHYGTYFAFLLVFLLGLRGGKVIGAPVRIWDSYTDAIAILNEMKLNPVFYLEKSLEQKLKNKHRDIHFMPVSKAIYIVRKAMHLKGTYEKNPIAREVHFDSVSSPKNVVLVLMESMATWKMKRFGNKEKRTPYLDSLYNLSYAFENLYSSGIHTYAGIYASLYAYPIIFDKHPMKKLKVKKMYGWPHVMKENGYTTHFFVSHTRSYDNLGSFLLNNGFDYVHAQEDYPADSMKTIWGADDRFLYNYALKIFDSLYKNNQKFFGAIMTITDHSPFYLPDFIKGENDYIRATRYADWSLGEFMRLASTKPWFKNTIFVFMGDHGETHGMRYRMPLTYNHIAGLIYYPGIKPALNKQLVSQMDIFPSVMHLLKLDYTNTTFGMDLFKYKRPYVYFNHDNLYGILDDEFYLIIDKNHTLGLYKYKNHDPVNYLKKYPRKAKEMETFLKAHIQTADYILRHDLQNKKR